MSSVTEEIKARLDIVDYVQRYVPLKKAGRYYKACCPFHSEKTPSFVVNPDTQSWRCFGACAEGGDVFSFAMKQNGWTFSEALQELGNLAGVEVQRQTPQQQAHNEEVDQLRGLLQTAADVYHEHLVEAETGDAAATLRYVQDKRGLTMDTIRQFGLGYAPPGWQNMLDYLTQLGYSADQVIEVGLAIRNDQGRVYDRFRNRLMIPIRDERGRVIGFGARALAPDDNPKYLNSPQTPVFDKSQTLFGLDLARRTIRNTETVVIVEGYLDVIQAHQAGFSNVVAQMGTAMTEPQLKVVAPRWAKKVILALDADAAGQSATMRSLEVARQTLQADYSGRLSVDIRILQIPGAKDPDDLIRETPEQWQALVDNAMPVADYVIETETAALPTNATVQEREGVARRLLPMLLASESNLYNQDNLQKLALRLRIGESDLLAWAQEQRRIDAARPPRQRATGAAAPDGAGMPEPPSLDYEGMEPPPEEDVSYESGDGPVQSHAVSVGRDSAVERYCLRVLLFNPDLLYQVNRKFRELAGDNDLLLNGPLNDLSADDFSVGDYRVLMQMFEAALAQDEMEPLDWLRQSMDYSLVSKLEALLVDDLDSVRHQIHNRMPAELTASWKQHERYVLPSVDLPREVVQRVLDLRQRRLKREGEELRFLQMDNAQMASDDGAALLYAQHIMLSMQARHLIEAELQRQGIYN